MASVILHIHIYHYLIDSEVNYMLKVFDFERNGMFIMVIFV